MLVLLDYSQPTLLYFAELLVCIQLTVFPRVFGAVPIAFNESDPVQQILAMSLEVGNAVWTVLDMKQSMRLCRRKVISFCAI